MPITPTTNGHATNGRAPPEKPAAPGPASDPPPLLAIVCARCGDPFGISDATRRRRAGDAVLCPRGHPNLLPTIEPAVSRDELAALVLPLLKLAARGRRKAAARAIAALLDEATGPVRELVDGAREPITLGDAAEFVAHFRPG